jgi:hypothetical protein
MLPMNGPSLEYHVPQAENGFGSGPAVLGGAAGGALVGALVLAGGHGWLAALAAYSLGGSLLAMAMALLPLMEVRTPLPALRPVYVPVRRGP